MVGFRGENGGLCSLVTSQYWAAWVISGIGLTLAGLSLWYLIIVKAIYIGAVPGSGPTTVLLSVIEVVLLTGFSLVLVYGGYWLATSPFDTERLWWAGLWTMIGLAGVVTLVALVFAFQVSQGQVVNQPTLVQEMLLAAGGGASVGSLSACRQYGRPQRPSRPNGSGTPSCSSTNSSGTTYSTGCRSSSVTPTCSANIPTRQASLISTRTSSEPRPPWNLSKTSGR
jgi:hypothetical protein